MELSRLQTFCIILFALFLTAACTHYYPRPSVAVAEEKMVARCIYLDTLAENSDMGKVQLHPKHHYDAQERVIDRAVKLGATHIVWLHNTPVGSAARAYQCPQ